MQIVNKGLYVEIVGKCLTEKDILELFKFGCSKDSIIKKYKKDNKNKQCYKICGRSFI